MIIDEIRKEQTVLGEKQLHIPSANATENTIEGTVTKEGICLQSGAIGKVALSDNQAILVLNWLDCLYKQ